MGDAIKEGCGHFGVAEDGYPFGEAQVCGDNEGCLFVELADQVEQQGTA